VLTRIAADVLIPGRGAPIRDAVVTFDGPTLDYAGPAGEAPATPGASEVRAAAVLPGMWDCHGHFFGMRSAALATYYTDALPLRAARAAKDAEIALQAGFTSIREAGGLGVHLARAVAEGTLAGPSIYAPGAILSTTGGHGDLHTIPLGWVHDLTEREGDGWLCDGVDECIRAVRAQLRLGAKVIKICASGGVLSEVDDPIHQQFNSDELRAIVETGGMAQRSVMAHCHGKPGIMAALEAGVRTIEHGTYLDDEVCAAMRELDAILVPTRYIIARPTKAGIASGMSAENARKLYEIADTHRDAISRAHAAGVRIAAGTDIFQSGADLPVGWGQNGAELPLLVEAGLSALEAIEAATANGPDTLGLQAPRAGQLREGWDADVITLDTDPSRDIGALADPARITGVWRHGVSARTPISA
jgi:imidazolonepropionase-like amidohydrolase